MTKGAILFQVDDYADVLDADCADYADYADSRGVDGVRCHPGPVDVTAIGVIGGIRVICVKKSSA